MRAATLNRLKTKLFLLSELIRRDLSSRYAGSFGGPAWALLNPLIFCGLYGFVFAVILKIPVPEGFPGRYVEFLLAGLLPWIGLQEALMRGSSSVSDQAHLVKKLRFPTELLVLSSVGAALVLQAAGLACLIGYGLVSGRGSLRPLTLAEAFLFETLVLVGPAFALAALNVFFRDLPQILPPVLMVAFYLTPILYPDALVPAPFSRLLAFNPFRVMASLFRAGLYGSAPPAAATRLAWEAFLVVLAFAGVRLFRRCRPSFSDLL